MALISSSKAKKQLAQNTRARRLQMDLTQAGLSKRSGVPLATLRNFEQKGSISLESFLKLQMVLGTLEDILQATQVKETAFSSIDDVLKSDNIPSRQRGKSE